MTVFSILGRIAPKVEALAQELYLGYEAANPGDPNAISKSWIMAISKFLDHNRYRLVRLPAYPTSLPSNVIPFRRKKQ